MALKKDSQKTISKLLALVHVSDERHVFYNLSTFKNNDIFLFLNQFK